MKKETPRSVKRGACLADGLDDSGARCGMPTTGRDHRQKRSPKERSAVSGTVTSVSQVALDHLGRSHHQMSQKRRLGSGQQDRWRQGDQPGQLAGLVVLCLQLGLSPTSKSWINNYGLRFRGRQKMKIGIST